MEEYKRNLISSTRYMLHFSVNVQTKTNMKLSSALLLISLLQGIYAFEPLHWFYPDTEYTILACQYAVSSVAVFCKKNNYACTCKNEAALGSIMQCLYNETSLHNEAIEKKFKEYCYEKGSTNITDAKMREAYDNATQYLIDPNESIPDFNKSIPISLPVYYKHNVFNKAFDSYKARFNNVKDSIYLGAGCLGYWALIFLFSTVYNFGSKIHFIGAFFDKTPFRKLRQHISMPALLPNKHHNEPYYPLGKKLGFISGVLPTRIETIIVALWLIMNILSQSIGYKYIYGNTIFKTKDAQMARYIGDRTGILATYGFTLTFLFVGRNNFLLWLTGWKQQTFVTYHKWISRINILSLMAHAGAMHVQSKALHKWETRITKDWYQYGIVASIAAGFLFVGASFWFRKNHYELFLMIHILMAIAFLVGTYRHITDFEYQNWAFAMIAVWSFDRLMRLGRLFSFGVQTAQATIVSGETIKLNIPKRRFWKTFPGAFGYIHFIKPTTFIQSHPFTIVSDSNQEIVFYVRIKGGVTSHVHRYLSSQPGKSGPIRVSVEGPYGDPKPLKRYDTSLFYAGGNGIPGLYAYAKKLTDNAERKIKLYWVIRNWHSIDWFYEELQSLKDTNVETIIYVTNPESGVATRFEDSTTGSSEDDETASKSSYNEKSNEKVTESHKIMSSHLEHIEFRYGRPHFDEVVKQDLQESTGNVAVMTCAHPKMTDDIRYVVKDNLDGAHGRVDLFEELQVW